MPLILQDKEVSSFHDGRYCDDIRETIMELLACNVSMAKVSRVIKMVLSKLGKQTVTKVPSISTISQIAVEARHLADLEVAEAIHRTPFLLPLETASMVIPQNIKISQSTNFPTGWNFKNSRPAKWPRTMYKVQ